MSGRGGPTRNHLIEYIAAQAGLTTAQATTVVAAIATVNTSDATGEVFGDVVGALLGPLVVQGIHGEDLTRTLAADANDYDSGDDTLIQRIDFAGHAITGIVAPDAPGEVRIYVAVSGGTLSNEAGTSTDVNRIVTGTGADLVLATDAAVVLLYDGTSNRWRVVGGSGAGGGTTWYEGAGAPGGGTGVDGDFYLNVTNGDVYTKVAGSWGVAVGNIKGPAGATGATGPTGATGATGPAGAITYQDHGNTGASEAVDMATADMHRLVLNAASVAITITTPPAAGTPGIARLWLEQDGVGGRLADWSGVPVTWQAGIVPTLQTAAGAIDQIDLVTVDGGSHYLGVVVGTDVVAAGTLTAPTFVGIGVSASGTGDVVPGLPAGHQVVDDLWLVVQSDNQAIAAPAGYTQAGPQVGIGTAAAAGATRGALFHKVDNGAEFAPTVTDTGDHTLAIMFATRGGPTVGDPFLNAGSSRKVVASVTGTGTGGATPVDNCLVLQLVFHALDSASAVFSAWANADLTSVTEQVDVATADGNGGGIGVATGLKAKAGTFAATTVTETSTVDCGLCLILLPAGLTSRAGFVDIQEFITAGYADTWAKPTGAVTYRAAGLGSASSGSAGRNAATAAGGGGGAGGLRLEIDGLAKELAATMTVTVGAGGAATANADGAAANGGNPSTIVSAGKTIFAASSASAPGASGSGSGGTGGNGGGRLSAAAAGTSSFTDQQAGGGAGGVTAGAGGGAVGSGGGAGAGGGTNQGGTAGGSAMYGGGGGGGGRAAATFGTGGASWEFGQLAGGASAGANGLDSTMPALYGGSGAAGGTSAVAAGAGGWPAGGGGGGGSTAGAQGGGKGGDGYILIETTCG